MQPTISFNLAGGPGVRITVVETADGKLQITAAVNAASTVGDLRGLFFHVADQSLLGGLSVTAATSPVGATQQSANAVNNLGGGVSIASAAAPMDFGVAIGTSSIAGADDIRSVTFTLQHATEALSLHDLNQMQFAAVLSSVGPAAGPRIGVIRALGTAPANAAPVAVDGNQVVAEDGLLNGSVAGLVSDAQNNGLTYSLVGPAPEGLVFNADGSYSYTPPANFDGDVQFQFKANDGAVDSNTATVSIDVTPVNDAPTDITLSNSSVPENSTDGTVVGVLSAADIDGGAASFSIVSGPSPFAVVGNELRVAGTLDFETTSSYMVMIRANDGAGGTYDELFTINVTDVNEGGGNVPPVVVNDSKTVNEDGVLNGNVAGLVTDVDSASFTFSIVGATPAGLVFNSDGSYTYTPAANDDTGTSFQFKANDGSADSNTGTVTIDILPVNDAPTVANDSKTVNEDGVHNGSVGGLVSDVDSASFTFSIVGATPAGLVFNSDGSYTYTPAANDDTGTSFQFKANDGSADSNTGTVTIDILPVNDAPTVANDSKTVNEDGVLNGSVAGLVSDIDSTSFTFSIVGATPAGLVFNSDGSYTYTPAANDDTGTSFQFKANDGSADSNTGTVTIDILPVNDAPTVANDSKTVNEDGVLNGSVAGLMTDVDSASFTFSIVGTTPAGLVFNSDGSYTYTPAANDDTGTSFQFKANDGGADSNTGTVTIDILPVNDAPSATGASVSTDEDTPLNGFLAGSDPEGSALSFALVTAPTQGVVSLNTSTGAYAYTPNLNTNGADSFSFRVNDGALSSAPATVSITVNPVNDAPSATGASVSTDEDTPLNGFLAGSDPEGSALSFALVTAPTQGVVSLNTSTGAYTYTPNLNTNGADSFSFRVNDGALSSAPATVSITVNPVNDAPSATGASVSTDEDTPLNGFLAGSDPEGSALSFALVTAPTQGVVSLNTSTGAYTYTPNLNTNGADSFSFRVNDGALNSAPATVSITVNPVNDAPTDIALSNNTVLENSAAGTVIGTLSASDIDGFPASFSFLGGPGPFAIDGNELRVNGVLDFETQASYSVTIRANDGAGGVYDELFTINVTDVNEGGGNQPPVANPGSESMLEDGVLNGTVTGSDPNGDAITFAVATPPAFGTLVLLAGGGYTYTPPANFNGAVSFAFTVSDGVFTSPPATVNITVGPVNDAPSVANDSKTVNEDGVLNGSVAGLVTDVDSASFTFAIVGATPAGLVFNSDGSYTYTPAANDDTGTSFQFKANDGGADSNTGTVTIDILPVNDAPTVANDSKTVNEDGVLNGSVGGLVSDVDSASFTFSIVGATPAGLVFNSDGSYTYTPAANDDTGTSFQFKANDGSADSNTGTVTIDIQPVNDAPTDITLSNNSVPENTAVGTVIGALAALDVDGGTASFSFVGSPGPFAIVGNQLRVNDALDFETQSSYSVTIRANDGALGTYDETFTINVTDVNEGGGNQPPMADPGSESMFEDGVLNGTVTGSDPNGDAITFAVATPPAFGTLVLLPGGGYTYTPPANFNGAVSFTFTVSDGVLTSPPATVNITVGPVNDAPTVANDSKTVNEDGVLNGSVAGLVADIDSASFTYSIVGATPAGLVFNPNGTYTYTPAASDDTGTSFQFKANDGSADSNTGTVTIDIQPVNDAPTDIALSNNAVPENSANGTLIGALSSTDIDGGGPTYSIVTPGVPFLIVGANQLVVSGALNFELQPSYNVTIRVDDGGALGTYDETFTINVTNVNEAPTANPGNAEIDEDQTLNASVSGSDPENSLLLYAVFGPAPEGAFSLNADGTYSYTPPANFHGAKSFQFTVSDGSFTSAPAMVNITVNPVNDAPVAAGSLHTINEDTTLNASVSATDADNNPLTYALFGALPPGTLVLNSNGTFTYTPQANFFGSTSFQFTASDGLLTSAPATVNIDVLSVNDLPTTPTGVSATIAEDTSTSFTFAQLLAGATDADGDPLTITQLFLGPNTTGMLTGTGLTIGGTANFNGVAAATYRVADTNGGSSIGTIALTVTPVNDAPAVSSATFNGTEDTPYVFSIAALLGQVASDIDGDGLSFMSATSPGHGTVGVAGDVLTFNPSLDHVGLSWFWLTVADPSGLQASNWQYIDVADVNDAPLANDDFVTRAPSPQTIPWDSLWDNDSDIDSPEAGWSITGIGNVQGVAVTINPGPRTLTVTYDPGFAGSYRFDYTLDDGEGASDTARVTLNTAPVAQNDAVTVAENAAYFNTQSVPVLANDSDADNDPLTLSAVSVLGGAPVSASGVGGTQLHFHLTDPYFNSTFQISYTASDGRGGTSSAVLTVTVTPENDSPYDPQGDDNTLNLSSNEDVQLSVPLATLLADDIDPEGDSISLFDLSPYNGSVSLVGPDVVFVPTPQFNGSAGFRYRTQDIHGALSNHIFVPVQVNALEDPPVATDDALGRSPGASQNIPFSQLLANDFDNDNLNGNGSDDDTLVITAVQAISGGTPVLDAANNRVVFDFSTGVAQFRYTLSDGTSTDTAIVTLNDPPTANDDAVIVFENAIYFSSQLVNVRANDTDPNGDTLNITSVTVLGGVPINADRWSASEIRFYSTNPDFNGTAFVEYTISDGFNSDTGLLTITITPQNDAPRDTTPVPGFAGQSDGIFAGTEDQPITVLKSDLLFDDADPDGDAIVWHDAVAYYGGSGIVDNGNSITLTPRANQEGIDYGFWYRVRDASGATSQPIYVVVNLAPVVDLIVANDEVLLRTGASQTVVKAQMTNNDVDPDVGDTKDITSAVAGNGITSITLNADDSVSITYAASYTGRAFYDYTVFDSQGHSDIARVTLNREPTADDDDGISGSEADNYLFIPYSALLSGDIDLDGDTLSVVPYNWGYFGSNIARVTHASEAGVGGVRAYLVDPFFGGGDGAYTGPAEFEYRVFDGHTYSNVAKVILAFTAGNDAPVAIRDNWYDNGATPFDTNPATNPMAGVEDGVLLIPANLLIDGQYIGTGYSNGRDTDEEGDTLSILAGSLYSYHGTVELIEHLGAPTVRFTPYPDTNSGVPYGDDSDPTRIAFYYQVSDGLRESNIAPAFVYIAPTDDVPVAVDDSFEVIASAISWTLEIGDPYGPFNVRANDSSPDDYPFGFDAGYTNITAVYSLTTGVEVQWNGFSVTATLLGDYVGDPVVFGYDLTDADGDSASAAVTLVLVQPRPAVFYFSGINQLNGRELWMHDPHTIDPNYGQPIATMVDEAETMPFEQSGDPREITALGHAAFWRGLSEQAEIGTRSGWHYHDAVYGYRNLFAEVDHDAFDNTLLPEEQNLGVRSGDLFWGAAYDYLYAWNLLGDSVASSYLPGHDRELLSDAGGAPAYAALIETALYDLNGDYFGVADAEQLFAVLYNPWNTSWDSLRITDGGSIDLDPLNDIREIAGLSEVVDPLDSSVRAKTFYFAGNFTGSDGAYRANELWSVTTTFNSGWWDTYVTPDFWNSNGTGGVIPANPHDLLVASVPDGSGGTKERLFLFQTDASGFGQIATFELDYFGGTGGSTGGGYYGEGFEGLEMKPWANGVVFSGLVDFGNHVVATWTDDDGDGFFDLNPVWNSYGPAVEQLTVDEAGHLAFTVDYGDYDYIGRWDGNSLSGEYIYGDVAEMAMAGGVLDFVVLEPYGYRYLYSYDWATDITTRVDTDEWTPYAVGDGFTGKARNVAIDGGLAFEGHPGQNTYTLHLTEGSSVIDTGIYVFWPGHGERIGNDWIGVGYNGALATNASLFRVELDGTSTVITTDQYLHADIGVLGSRVLFGISESGNQRVLSHDTSTSSNTQLLSGHTLGRAQTIGSEVIFNAQEVATGIWKLFSWNGLTATFLANMPAVDPGGSQPVSDYEWYVDFFGDAQHLFWRQSTAGTGQEVFVLDRSSGNVSAVDIRPGANAGALYGYGSFVNGRFFWQATADGTTDSLRLYSTIDGSNPTEITGPLLIDLPNRTQFPYTQAVLGNKLYFIGISVDASQGGNGNYAIFEVNSDGVSGNADDVLAAMVSPTTFGFITGLTTIDSSLYFIDDRNGMSQMWQMVPGSAPLAVTSFTEQSQLGDIFEGGDGLIYFSRNLPGEGRELWVVDDSVPEEARLVAELNFDTPGDGFQPQGLVAVPDPLLPFPDLIGSGGGGG